jgi:hypothetical protein
MNRKHLITVAALAIAFAAALASAPALAADAASRDDGSARLESRHNSRSEAGRSSDTSASYAESKALSAIGGGPGGFLPGGGHQAICTSCTGICQTLVIFGGSDIFWDVDGGGGLTPSQCVDAIAAKCGQAYLTLLSSANCQQ